MGFGEYCVCVAVKMWIHFFGYFDFCWRKHIKYTMQNNTFFSDADKPKYTLKEVGGLYSKLKSLILFQCRSLDTKQIEKHDIFTT